MTGLLERQVASVFIFLFIIVWILIQIRVDICLKDYSIVNRCLHDEIVISLAHRMLRVLICLCFYIFFIIIDSYNIDLDVIDFKLFHNFLSFVFSNSF